MTIFDVKARAVTSHAAVQTVLREPGWSSDHRNSPSVPEMAGDLLSKILLFTEGPDHTRLRGLVSKAFTPRSVERLRPRISALTEELLAPLRHAGQFDVIGDFAFPLPVRVICELLGVPSEDQDLFRLQTRDMAAVLNFDATAEQLGAAVGAGLELTAYLVPLFVERKHSPKDDLISALVAVEEAGDTLGADELLMTVILLLAAGHETTMNLIGNGLLALLRNRDQLELLRERPDLMPGAVEELLRYDSPVRCTLRTALRDTELEGQTVRAGEQVLGMIDAANHDPAVFELPDTLDVTRDARRHLSFGAGAHYCLGAALARAEAQIALTALIALPNLELAIDEPVWRPLAALHALESLPVATGTGRTVRRHNRGTRPRLRV